jgi:hypothetical protein
MTGSRRRAHVKCVPPCHSAFWRTLIKPRKGLGPETLKYLQVSFPRRPPLISF